MKYNLLDEEDQKDAYGEREDHWNENLTLSNGEAT